MQVVIADDHEVVRIGLRTILEQSGEGYKVVGEASTGRGLLKLLAGTRCDLVIVDFLMPEEDETSLALDGVALLHELRRLHPKLPIVVLTMMRNSAIFRTIYQEGVDAVVEKARVVEDMLIALRTVRAGRTYVSKQVGEHLDGYAARSQAGKAVPVLSMREAEVVRMFAQGRSITDIAALTHRSVKTISRQKRSAMEKLGLSSDGQLFEYARTHGLAG
ncbi:response regulator transcription factor [Dyella nitratireducens]|uniref:DNA-binding response regulator n=1 Tax=Dyella nitratireducens TaxID=1849580 RepID=A0ABQ1GF79_9GAMM|nr:response regulator transcription factor [Dyella nitratireducens]GGA42517.1 DNA-binding response regulator [Dyella nitratireducens]